MTQPRPDVLRIAHHHPGRLRLRADLFRTEPGAVDEVRAAMSHVKAVKRVSSNPTTGSLLLEYDPGPLEPDELVAQVARAAGLRTIEDETRTSHDPSDLVRLLAKGGRQLNHLAGEATQGRADLRSLLPIGMLVAGVYSLVRRPLLPRWDNLFIWSFQLFVTMNRPGEPEEARGRT